MTFPFRPEPLGKQHERSLFRCGEDAPDRYFQTQVTQDIRRHIANCFVAVESATSNVAAHYTISAASIPLVDLRPDETKRLPRYPTVPAVRIARLAVDQRFQGRGLGAALLADAAARALKADAAAFTLLVDAKNDQAVAFYQRFGFRILASQPRTLFLPLATAKKTFCREG
ncbi:MAG TPA: GNAT family N-acetyltransferase [Bryobacteraceae bacterium]|jgi:ribosomal protein S18 acetylase RimI-like enzyme|nr:GNAT family N-acetyltransferase [Bryobacteraceae bacterium]